MNLNNELQTRWEKANKAIAEYQKRYEECLQDEARFLRDESERKATISQEIHHWIGYQIALKEVYNLTNHE